MNNIHLVIDLLSLLKILKPTKSSSTRLKIRLGSHKAIDETLNNIDKCVSDDMFRHDLRDVSRTWNCVRITTGVGVYEDTKHLVTASVYIIHLREIILRYLIQRE